MRGRAWLEKQSIFLSLGNVLPVQVWFSRKDFTQCSHHPLIALISLCLSNFVNVCCLNTTHGSWCERRDDNLRVEWAWSRLVSETAPAQTCHHQAAPVWGLPWRIFRTGWDTAHATSICCCSCCCKSCKWIGLTGSDHQSSQSSSNPLLWLMPEVSQESRRTCSSWKSCICYLSAKPRTESDDSLGADLWEAFVNVTLSNHWVTPWNERA